MERNLMFELKQLELLGKAYRPKNPVFKRNLNFTQVHILIFLFTHEDEDICQKDLEIETGLKKASITGTLNSLEDKGYIIREVSSDDKRRNHIVLTEKSLNIKKHIQEGFYEFNQIALKGFDDEDRKELFRLIDMVENNLKGGMSEADF
ncbi:MAG: MarR family transcriptional regulator [Erysipelotrichaceae bacterium]|nr:MarR family transcriptional regulator [Erysipelotrichaceae bacterium]